MARTRIIKPDFFANEDMVKLTMPARLLFIALWTMADRRGRLEDRPLKIRRESFPYEDINVDPLLDELRSVGFIVRYEAEGQKCIHVVNFEKHQNPHKNEVESELPAPPRSSHSRNVPSGSDNGGSPSANLGTTPACPDPDPCPDRDEQKAPLAGLEEGKIDWLRRLYRPKWDALYRDGLGFYPDSKADHTAWDNYAAKIPADKRRGFFAAIPRLLDAFLADPDPKLKAERHALWLFPDRAKKYATAPPKAVHKPESFFDPEKARLQG